MTWTEPKTWVAGDPLTAAVLNTEIRDNLLVLRNPVKAERLLDEANDYSITNTGWVDIDTNNLSHTVTTEGGDLLIGFTGLFRYNEGGGNLQVAHMDVEIDGVRFAGDDGLVGFVSLGNANNYETISFVVLKTDLSAGEHTVKVVWKSPWLMYVTLYAGAGTIGFDTHPQFWVLEVQSASS